MMTDRHVLASRGLYFPTQATLRLTDRIIINNGLASSSATHRKPVWLSTAAGRCNNLKSAGGQVLHLRCFLSSPGDVSAERAAARKLLEDLSKGHLLKDRVEIRVVA